MGRDLSPEVAVYDFAHVFHWVVENPKGARAKLLWQLHNSRACPFCRLQMIRDELNSGIATPADYIVVCPQCGFWFGRGTKRISPDESDWGAPGGRGAMGLLHPQPLSELDITLPEVLRFLNSEHALLTRIDPFQAEELVCELLRKTFGWEVKHVGRRRDEGVDAIAVLSGRRKSIVQIKWHRTTRRAESVSLVREFAGTLLARGVPNGLIVTTSDRFSSDALREIEAVAERHVSEVGRLSIEYKTYQDLLAMLQITARRVSETPQVPIRLTDRSWYCLFDGNGIWDAAHRDLRPEERSAREHEWIDPLKILLAV